MVLEKTLKSPLDYKDINQPILKEISPGCSLEGLMLKLKLQTLTTWCEELTHLKRPWCWERLRAGGEGDYRGWDGWMASPIQGTWVWVDFGSWWWTGSTSVLGFMGSQRVGHDHVPELNCEQPGKPGGKESTCQFRRHRLDPWFRKIPQCFRATKPMCHNSWAWALEPRWPSTRGSSVGRLLGFLALSCVRMKSPKSQVQSVYKCLLFVTCKEVCWGFKEEQLKSLQSRYSDLNIHSVLQKH